MRLMRAFALVCVVLGPGSALGACPALLDHRFPALIEGTVDLCGYNGKVVLVVNTASQCGYTPQYKGLQALYRRYRDRGLVILGFPANDFGGQEPGSSQEIAEFCEVNFGVDFPMFAKSQVVPGRDINPLYAMLAAKTGDRPRWNFHKYLIGRNGNEVYSFASGVTPESARLVDAIEHMLGPVKR